MACMCGDVQCGSCGPAQGNFKCELCGTWADTGCKHLRKDGTYKQTYKKQVAAKEDAERVWLNRYAKDLEADGVVPIATWKGV